MIFTPSIYLSNDTSSPSGEKDSSAFYETKMTDRRRWVHFRSSRISEVYPGPYYEMPNLSFERTLASAPAARMRVRSTCRSAA